MPPISSSSSSDSDNVNLPICNFCGKKGDLFPNKPYCLTCKVNAFKVCKSCHKPYDDEKYFKLSTIRCNSCEKKVLSLKAKKRTNSSGTVTKSKKLKSELTIDKKCQSDKNSPVNGEVVLEKEEKPSRKRAFIPIYFEDE